MDDLSMNDKTCATCRHWTGLETVKGTKWCGQLHIYVYYMFACKAWAGKEAGDE